ncbi:MAG: LysR family transcriptional regulator [Deltaproteobacteria bacterium]|nr:LysR family transcriptional regulator [Deltaproteobacteria bacterium]
MLDSFRHLLLIAEHGTFTEAARRAHLSQPALTTSIRRLEERIGARLFVRSRRGAELTAAGRAVLPHARAALVATDEARRAAAEIEGLAAGEVRIGGGATVCTYLLPPLLAQFRRRHPNLALRIRELHTDAALDALSRGALDLAIVPTSRGELFRRDELILVASPGVDPATASFVTLARGTTTRELLDRHFPNADIAMELGSLAVVKGHVRAGLGVALISRSAVALDLAHGRLVEIRNPATPIRRPFRLLHRGLDRLSPSALELRRTLLPGTGSR